GGYVEMRREYAEDSEFRQRLSAVKHAADRATVLTRQLLAFSRRQVMQTKVVDLNQVVQHLIGMITRLIKENVELTFLPARGLGYVRIDPYQIERVIINLTVNAQDARRGGGRLPIKTGNVRMGDPAGRRNGDLPAGDFVLLQVRDTGHGMDAEVQARAFEPFFTT